MAKTTPKAKNSAFMKPMQPSEHLAKIVGTEPLPRSEVTKKIWAQDYSARIGALPRRSIRRTTEDRMPRLWRNTAEWHVAPCWIKSKTTFQGHLPTDDL